jgi:hypothetical protein
MAVRTLPSSADVAVAVLHPGDGSPRPGSFSATDAVVGLAAARLGDWLAAAGCAGLAVQPAHPMTAQATAARPRMSACYAGASSDRTRRAFPAA